MKLNKKDIRIILGLMLIYLVVALYNLGDFKVPETYHEFKDKEQVVLTMDEEKFIINMRYYTGNLMGTFKVKGSLDNKEYMDIGKLEVTGVFKWEDFKINGRYRYVLLEAVGKTVLGDVVLYDENDDLINYKTDAAYLNDEVKLVPSFISYRNSTYFDEIYFARSAYEYVNSLDTYEWTHPPIGKLIMAIPVWLFGFSPFNYRIMGVIAGVLMIPVMYSLGALLFKEHKWAILGALFITFDNFHLAHSRIALVDTFLVLFIMLSILFFKKYLLLGKEEKFKKTRKYLMLSGLFIGLAIGTKWTGLYAGVGLAIYFFYDLFIKYKKPFLACIKNHNKYLFMGLNLLITIPLMLFYMMIFLFSSGMAKIYIVLYYLALIVILLTLFLKKNWRDKYLIKLFFISILSFIILPIGIYIISYLIFPNVSWYDGTFKGIWDQTIKMYNYHSGLEATHSFSSSFYSWLIMARPVWYYRGYSIGGMRETISGIGNPILWIGGTIGVIYTLYKAIRKRDDGSIFMMVFYLASFVPYILVSRIMFMYHYYICIPFAFLSLVNLVKDITIKLKSDSIYYFIVSLTIICFIIFYPVSSGLLMPDDYIESVKWLSSWGF